MNKIRIFIFLLVSPFSFSQQDELLYNEWFLEKLVINETEYYPPITNEFENIYLDFGLKWPENPVYYMISEVCAPLGGTVAYLNDSEFLFGDFYCCGTGMCTNPENIDFEYIYAHFYEYYFEAPFSYTIINNENGSKTLTIISVGGHQAIYNNQTLFVADDQKQIINIYPNPVKDKLIVENPDLKITQIKITDSSGRLIMTKEINSVRTEIEFNSLPKAIYFITLESNGKIRKTEKLIKD